MSGQKYIRGALIEFTDAFVIPLPNVILFQYNPESMTHAWTQPEAAAATPGDKKQNPLAVQGDPGQSFTFTISMHAGDVIADGNPVTAALAEVSGIATRLAALEMLQYPVGKAGGALVGAVSSLLGGGGSSPPAPIPQLQLPTVLFVWGPGRIVPVRVTSLSTTELLYDGLLTPTYATAQITLRVLTPKELEWVNGPLKEIARGAYTYTQSLREVLAVANLVNATDSIIGMLPL